MFKSFIYNLLEKRHYWRYASFSEIAELYTSRTLRTIAIHLASGFASVYLYQTGYSLTWIITMWLVYFAAKIPMSFFAGHIAAWFGPKHGILLSNILAIPAMAVFGFVPVIGENAIFVWLGLSCLSAAIYQICYTIDFSKIKNAEHAGKEIAFMNILDKVAVGVSPLIGGVVALFFGPQVIMWVAAVFYLVAAIPLLLTAEPLRIYQRLAYRGFRWRLAFRNIFSQIGIGFDVVTTGTIWSLFIAIIIFPNEGDEVYVLLGGLSSVTIIAAILTSYAYGKLIDRRRGRLLMRISVIGNALVHLSRPFASTPVSIVGTNIVNEVATMGYVMPYTRGVFDTADISGYRILYVTVMEALANIGAVIACITTLVLIGLSSGPQGLHTFFFVAAGFVLLIGTASFRLYRK